MRADWKSRLFVYLTGFAMGIGVGVQIPWFFKRELATPTANVAVLQSWSQGQNGVLNMCFADGKAWNARDDGMCYIVDKPR